MMHGRGESDSAIVAAKPTNKAERSAAESVERRAEAKGNAGQQSTGRTQSRVTVSQALERIRHVARIPRSAVTHPRWEPYARIGPVRIWCSEASCHSSGCKSRQQRSPVAVVVIPRNGEGDRSVESREVKAPDGWAFQSDPYRGASKLTGCSKRVNQEAPKASPAWNGLREGWECRAAQISAKATSASTFWIETMTELPGVKEDGMSGRNVQRKLGTTRGSPRRSRTAKALRISRSTVKSRCACEWGGWGRVSDDGSGHYNPNPSEGPWGGGSPILHGSALSSPRPDTVRDYRSDHEVHDGRRQTGRRPAYAGSRLELSDAPGRSRLIRQPSSRTGENPPYGMIGGIEETSASFEARSAPRSHPTAGGVQ